MTGAAIIRKLGLAPHPEGGHFRETFRAPELPSALPGRGSRAASTAIYFLLEPGDFSAFHSVLSDEVWHHYLGGTLELVTIDPNGGFEERQLGTNLERGEVPQLVVPAGVLQAARPAGDDFVLVGCTVAPGFDFADFKMPPRAELVARFPAYREAIERLTRA